MTQSNTVKQVLLCGTAYGQSYLPAIFQDRDLELAGILSRGSDQSRRLAEQYGVELYLQADDVPDNIDLACLAIPEDPALNLAEFFLKKNTHILIEHPVGAEGIHRLKTASENIPARCHINSHFPELPPTREFIALCQKLNRLSEPQSIIVQCNSRTLFSTIDILMRCFEQQGLVQQGLVQEGLIQPSYQQLNFTPQTISSLGHYIQATTLLNTTPCSINYQKWRYARDNSEDSPLGHGITMSYPEGVLQLCGSFGPCLWMPTISQRTPLDLPISQHSDPHQPSSPPNVRRVIEWRKRANQTAINSLFAVDLPYYHTMLYQQQLCQTWSQLFEAFGCEVVEERNTMDHHRFFSPQTIINTTE